MLALPVDVFSAAFPLFLKVSRVRVRAGLHAHEDATLLDTRFVVFDTLFGDVPSNKRSDNAPAGCASTAPSERRG